MPEPVTMLRWMTPQQTADNLQISLRSLQQMQTAGNIPFSRLNERVIRFDRATVDEWAASRSADREPTEDRPTNDRSVVG